MQLVFDVCLKYPKGEFNKEFKSDKSILRNAAFFRRLYRKKTIPVIPIRYKVPLQMPTRTH
jgi:hypothetical protein